MLTEESLNCGDTLSKATLNCSPRCCSSNIHPSCAPAVRSRPHTPRAAQFKQIPLVFSGVTSFFIWFPSIPQLIVLVKPKTNQATWPAVSRHPNLEKGKMLQCKICTVMKIISLFPFWNRWFVWVSELWGWTNLMECYQPNSTGGYTRFWPHPSSSFSSPEVALYYVSLPSTYAELDKRWNPLAPRPFNLHNHTDLSSSNT